VSEFVATSTTYTPGSARAPTPPSRPS
jgi:hypothetical protein